MDTGKINAFFSSLTTQKLISGLVVFAVGAIIINIVIRLYNRHADKLKLSLAMRSGLRTLIKILLWALLFIGTAGTMGVNISSLVALFSIFSLAISLAVQGTLSNLAGGLQVLTSHPFSVGDFVKIGEHEGTVVETGLVYTKLMTVDNREIYIPNSSTASSGIINYTASGRRRMEFKFGLPYESDPDAVMKALRSAIAATDRLLDAPAKPFVAIHEYADSSVTYIVRFWVLTPDYWDVHYAFHQNVWNALKEEKLEFPYPQTDVHIKQ